MMHSKLERDFYTVRGVTHDVVVKGLHSHNDYWRSRPLLDALSVGCVSVESDVWWDPESEDVYVGHSINSLRHGKTLEKMYVDPLVSILKGANDAKIGREYKHRAGVWFTEPSRTLFLFIDFKTDGKVLYSKVLEKLSVLEENGWISYYDVDTDKFVWSAITVIGTGNVALEDVLNCRKRMIFYDGPIWDMDWKYDYRVSPVASGSLSVGIQKNRVDISGLNNKEMEFIRNAVARAQDNRMKTRIWDTPGWPVKLRDTVWEELVGCGVDLLNVDNVSEGAAY